MRRPAVTPGVKYGKLTAIRFIEKRPTGHNVWLWKCDCGNEHKASSQKVMTGNTSSCGCLQQQSRIERGKTGGLYGTYIYRIWTAMNRRCVDENLPAYPNYGGRGIKVCDRWKKSFLNFLEDMGQPPTDEHTIDRKDVDGNYEPGNCRWLTRAEQQRNRRNNRYVEFRGKITLQVDCCLALGLRPNNFRIWLDKGISADELDIVLSSGINWTNPIAMFYIETPDTPIEKALVKSRYVIINTEKLSDDTVKYKVIWDPCKK